MGMTAPDDAAVFAQAFNRLRRRFLLGPDDEVAADYYAYLSGVLSLDEMLTAMGGLWATREFFPKPADFVLAFAPAEWTRVQHAMAHWPDSVSYDDRKALLDRLSARTRAACHALGGIGTMRDVSDVLRLKREFEKCYADAVQAEAMTLPIMPEMRGLAAGRKQIGSGNP